MNVKFLDLFAGIGGFHIALDSLGWECVHACEINEYARQTYKDNFSRIFPSVLSDIGFSNDITKIDTTNLKDFDVLCAGFPCQPFSICGIRRGFEDTRGTLFFNICEIIFHKNPRVVFLENVKHLLHHNNGRTLAVIIEALEDLGYNVSYGLVNAVNFGVPQNRERVIIIGSRNKKFDFGKIKQQMNRPSLEEFLDSCGNFEYLDQEDYILLENTKMQKDSGLIFSGYRKKNIWKKGIRENTEHLSRVHRQPNRIYSVKGTHPTLPSQESSGRFFIYDNDKDVVRKMTLSECYRIMGFPNDYKINPVKSEAYKQIGNSVCVPMIKEIAKQLEKQILNDHDKTIPFTDTYKSFRQQELQLNI
jgi:DNA (cytosine-5)-methyltransferase 1